MGAFSYSFSSPLPPWDGMRKYCQEVRAHNTKRHSNAPRRR